MATSPFKKEGKTMEKQIKNRKQEIKQKAKHMEMIENKDKYA